MKISAAEKDQLQTLEAQSHILNSLYIRNKNQHRHSIWWKHFSIFRKQVNGLLNEISTTSGDSYSDQVNLSLAAQQRVNVWITKYVAAWNAAFSQLIMERRFANLGLLLLAVLARVCAITGIPSTMAAQGRKELLIEDDGSLEQILQVDAIMNDKLDAVDFGEVIERFAGQPVSEVVVSSEAVENHKPRIKAQEQKKKSRGKAGDTIGDIFAAFER